MSVSKKERAALIERHRFINAENTRWWERVVANFKSDMRDIGINVEHVHFSVLAPQESGVCFTGRIENVITYLDDHHQGEFPLIRMFIEHGGTVRGYNMRSSRGRPSDTHTFVQTKGDFQNTLSRADLVGELELELELFEDKIEAAWRAHTEDIHYRIMEEFEFLLSDEAVWVAIEANSLWLEGTIYDELNTKEDT